MTENERPRAGSLRRLRWSATLTYTIDDDGVWLSLGDKRVNLGFEPTLREALDVATQLEREEA